MDHTDMSGMLTSTKGEIPVVGKSQGNVRALREAVFVELLISEL